MIPGILFILVGMALLILTYKGYATSSIGAVLTGSYMLIFGIVLCIAIYLENDTMAAFTVGLGVGLLFLGLGAMNIFRVFACSKKIEGTFRGAAPFSDKNGVTLYAPIFEYMIDRRKYQSQCGATYRKKYLQKRYSVDGTYHIYINPKNPQVFVIKKRIPFTTWLLLFMGFLFIYVIFYFFG